MTKTSGALFWFFFEIDIQNLWHQTTVKIRKGISSLKSEVECSEKYIVIIKFDNLDNIQNKQRQLVSCMSDSLMSWFLGTLAKRVSWRGRCVLRIIRPAYETASNFPTRETGVSTTPKAAGQKCFP